MGAAGHLVRYMIQTLGEKSLADSYKLHLLYTCYMTQQSYFYVFTQETLKPMFTHTDMFVAALFITSTGNNANIQQQVKHPTMKFHP